MSARRNYPVRVLVTVGARGTRVLVNGLDLTDHCRVFKVEAGEGALPDVWLNLIGVDLDILADVPPKHVQQLSLEEDQAHREAQLTIDQQRGQREYGRKGITPGVQLAISLGTRTQEPA
jgi:hypothetical protein